MKEYYILLFIKIVYAVFFAVIAGNGAVFWFNKMPVRWFDDDGLPEDIEQRQRITSTPWKYVFVSYFAACGIYLSLTAGIEYEIGVLTVLFFVLEMAISDIKYMIVPDQLNIMLAITALGFIRVHEHWYNMPLGAVLGIILALITYGLGKLIYKREVIGGADIKFYIAIGMVTGVLGVAVIFALTSLVMWIHEIFLVYNKRIEKHDALPMLPYALIATTVYTIFIWPNIGLI